MYFQLCYEIQLCECMQPTRWTSLPQDGGGKPVFSAVFGSGDYLWQNRIKTLSAGVEVAVKVKLIKPYSRSKACSIHYLLPIEKVFFRVA